MENICWRPLGCILVHIGAWCMHQRQNSAYNHAQSQFWGACRPPAWSQRVFRDGRASRTIMSARARISPRVRARLFFGFNNTRARSSRLTRARVISARPRCGATGPTRPPDSTQWRHLKRNRANPPVLSRVFSTTFSTRASHQDQSNLTTTVACQLITAAHRLHLTPLASAGVITASVTSQLNSVFRD